MQQLRESICDYDTFIKDITEMVKEMMGKEYSAKIYKVTKNNSLELDSLVLLKSGANFTPNIYLLPYYNAYSEGTDMLELANRLCAIYRSYDTPKLADGFSYTFENIKHSIVYRLVSYDKNKKLMEKIPHIKFLDLAVTYHCLVLDDESGIGSIRITNEHLESWNISIKELHKFAVINTKKEFPPVIRSMDEIIHSMLIGEDHEGEYNTADEILQDTNIQSKCNNMYVLSNPKGINGATCLLYKNVLKEFSMKVQSDLFILPSSIHEVILIPINSNITKEALTEMVKDVNRTQVACDEVLSDRVYYYSRANNAIV
jgi:hypothetical protein